MEGPVEINAVALEEPAEALGNIQGYRVEGQVDSDWTVLAEGQSIRERIVHRFPTVVVWKVRLSILKAAPFAAIRGLELYRAPVEREPPGRSNLR